jgi:hypothetical protein
MVPRRPDPSGANRPGSEFPHLLRLRHRRDRNRLSKALAAVSTDSSGAPTSVRKPKISPSHCENAGGKSCALVSTFRNHRHWNDGDGSSFPLPRTRREYAIAPRRKPIWGPPRLKYGRTPKPKPSRNGDRLCSMQDQRICMHLMTPPEKCHLCNIIVDKIHYIVHICLWSYPDGCPWRGAVPSLHLTSDQLGSRAEVGWRTNADIRMLTITERHRHQALEAAIAILCSAKRFSETDQHRSYRLWIKGSRSVA